MNVAQAMQSLLQAMQPTALVEKSLIGQSKASPRIYFQRSMTNRDVDLGGAESSLQETTFDVEAGSLNDEDTAQTIVAALKDGVTLTTLNGAINASTGTVVVHSATAMLAAANFVITIDAEQLLVTVISGTSLTVTRGFSGTAAASHSDGANVTMTGLNGLRGALGNSGIFCHGAFVEDHTDDYVPKMLDADEGYFTAAFQVHMIHEGG
jgi:hypothetical protein